MNRVATILREVEDEEIVQLLRAGDLTGAKLLIEAHGRDAVEALRAFFGSRVGEDVLDLAVCQAAALLLRAMKRMDSKATLRAVFFMTARCSVLKMQGGEG